MSVMLLLLLLVVGSQGSHYYGTVMTFTPKHNKDDGSVTVVFHYKLSFRSCTDNDVYDCISGDCGEGTVELNVVDKADGAWCHIEGVMIRQVATNAPFQLRMDGGAWIGSINNGVSSWMAVTQVDLRTRSDTDLPNTSPQTTILPALRVPSNCQRNIALMAFDPDGDEVVCRYGVTAAEECNPCSPPSVLGLSRSCILSFNPTSSSNEGAYAVQVEMEDFPDKTISLLQSDGTETTRTPSDALSKIPIRFALIVDPAVPSCTEGHYLPKFLPPTPVNGAWLTAFVNKNLNISIKAEAANSQISEVFFSGPHGIVKNTGSDENFVLSWTPTEEQDGENHPICFVVEAVNNPTKYHSELRCVIVRVTIETPTTVLPTTIPPTTSVPVNEPEDQSYETSRPDESKISEDHSNKTMKLDESKTSDDEKSGAGKVIGIVFGVGVVVGVAAVAIWAARSKLLALPQSKGINSDQDSEPSDQTNWIIIGIAVAGIVVVFFVIFGVVMLCRHFGYDDAATKCLAVCAEVCQSMGNILSDE